MADDVLIVEDEEDLADLYAEQLREEFSVTVAYDGEGALEIIEDRGEALDAVLLDRRMPDVSGDEVLDAIRERGLGCSVAMVTAVNPEFDIVGMGFDDYLTKPVTAGELRDTVERLVAQSSYDEEVRDHLTLVAERAALEAEKTRPELEDSEEYARLERAIAESRERMDAELAGDVFVELLLTQTGDWLHLVLQYDAEGWDYRYVGDRVEERVATVDIDLDGVVEQFREEGGQNARLNDALDLEGYHCSLHLFDVMVLLHLYQSSDRGIVCGFDPDAAAHLTDFVSLVRPYIEEAVPDAG